MLDADAVRESAASRRASLAKGSKAKTAWVGTGGSWSGHIPGSLALGTYESLLRADSTSTVTT